MASSQRKSLDLPDEERHDPERQGRDLEPRRLRHRPGDLQPGLALVDRREAHRRHRVVRVPPPRDHARGRDALPDRRRHGDGAEGGPRVRDPARARRLGRRRRVRASSTTSPGREPSPSPAAGRAERVLATLVVTDIVDSTPTAERMGASAWATSPRRPERRQPTSDRQVPRQGRRHDRRRPDRDLRRGRAGDPLWGGDQRGSLTPGHGPARRRPHRRGGDPDRRPARAWRCTSRAGCAASGQPGRSSCREPPTSWSPTPTSAFEDRGTHELKGVSGARHIWALLPEAGGPIRKRPRWRDRGRQGVVGMDAPSGSPRRWPASHRC